MWKGSRALIWGVICVMYTVWYDVKCMCVCVCVWAQTSSVSSLLCSVGGSRRQLLILCSRQKEMLQILCVNASNCCSEASSGTDPCTVWRCVRETKKKNISAIFHFILCLHTCMSNVWRWVFYHVESSWTFTLLVAPEENGQEFSKIPGVKASTSLLIFSSPKGMMERPANGRSLTVNQGKANCAHFNAL